MLGAGAGRLSAPVLPRDAARRAMPNSLKDKGRLVALPSGRAAGVRTSRRTGAVRRETLCGGAAGGGPISFRRSVS
jgi:hypothetical protein